MNYLNPKNLKYWFGKRLRHPYLVITLDDFGNIRNSSAESRLNLKSAGIDVESNWFDRLDGLCTSNDMEELITFCQEFMIGDERGLVLSPYINTRNMNFESTLSTGEYVPESLVTTLTKSEHECRLLKQWERALSSGVFEPEYHGAEHINVPLINRLLKVENEWLIHNLSNHSLSGLLQDNKGNTVHWSEAYAESGKISYDLNRRNFMHGIEEFENFTNRRRVLFNAPGANTTIEYIKLAKELNFKGIDRVPFVSSKIARYFSLPKYHFQGQNFLGLRVLQRNISFEPVMNSWDTNYVKNTARKIARLWNNGLPAVVSIHRLNFTSRVDADNGACGLKALQKLLDELKEFGEFRSVSARELLMKYE